MKQALANLEVFAATLLELAREYSELLVVTSDSRGSAKLAPFARAAPDQEEIFRNYGIDGPGLAATARQVLARE
jgi:transketolase